MENIVPFDWFNLLVGDKLPVSFLGEIVLRSIIMYILILITLRVMGKRGIKQLSMFEFSIILALGSAAGDPMFYKDVPLLHGVTVFVVILSLYLLFNFITEQSELFEKWFEGSSSCIILDGKINLTDFKKQKLTYMELFGEMRQQQVEHLGQVKKVYLEATGEISIFFYEAEATKPGLPIFPEILAQARPDIKTANWYACKKCGHVDQLQPATSHTCRRCKHNLWLPACRALRVT